MKFPVIVSFIVLLAFPVRAESELILQGGFLQQRYLVGFDTPFESTGEFILVPSMGLIWQTESPFGITTVITPHGLVQVMEGTEINKVNAAKIVNLKRFFSMLTNTLSGRFDNIDGSVFNLKKIDLGSGKWRATISATASSHIDRIEAEGEGFVTWVTIFKANGDFDELRFIDQVHIRRELRVGEASLFTLTIE